MTLIMGDGPVANLPPGLNAYGGYVNVSGIGKTYPDIVVLAKAQNAIPFSITTDGSPAQCADVESGAMSDWTGYTYGYCSVSNVNSLIAKYGRPTKLLTAHQDSAIGAHICSPTCWPGLVTTADGTQWVDHNGQWDESLLSDNFFTLAPAPPNPPEGIPEDMITRVWNPDTKQMETSYIDTSGNVIVITVTQGGADNGKLRFDNYTAANFMSNGTAPKAAT